MTQQKATAKKRKVKRWEKAFITALSTTGVVSRACDLASVDRGYVYRHRAEHADFAEAWDEALEIAADQLEAEARRRAIEGVEEPVFGSGGRGVGTVQVGTVIKYSDTLLMFLLKGARPEKYRERHDHALHSPGSDRVLLESFEASLAKIYPADGEEAA